MAKSEKRKDFSKIVKNRKLPILTLDGRWHGLFSEGQKTERIRELEQEVNNLLKKQGKLVNDIKDMKKLKNTLLKEIMVNMDISRDSAGRQKEKKIGQNKQFVTELNEKIENAMDELAEIPYQIKILNEELMTESISVFYNLLEENKLEINEVTQWIAGIREELKKKILIKQDLETKNTLIYTYMHDILGPEMMEFFDREHDTK